MQKFGDTQLLELLKNGSMEAYEILFKKYFKLLCMEASLYLSDAAEAEDLVLEIFIEIWDKKIFQKIDYSFKAYVYKAVRNKCINLIKKNKVLKEKHYNYGRTRHISREPLWLEQEELAQNIDNILMEFPAQRLKAFTLVYFEKKKYQEAANEMGLSINSVKTHLKLALEVLRIKLKKFR